MPKPICDICKQPITTKERMRFKEDKHERGDFFSPYFSMSEMFQNQIIPGGN